MALDKDLKTIHFTIPRALYEEFDRFYSGRGAKKGMFLKMISAAIEIARENDLILTALKAVYREREDEG